MSNTAVGAVFKKIIDQVVESSRTDFEENGIDASVLASLQESWQQRLTASHRAAFPWDPQPQQTPPTQQQPPQQQQHQQQQPPQPTPANPNAQTNSKAAIPNQQISNGQASTPHAGQMGGMPIKQESGYETPQFLNLPQTTPYVSHPNAATNRAAQLMHQSFGNQASQSISALHAQNAVQRQSMQPGGVQPGPNGQQYQHQQMPPVKTEAHQGSLGNAQTDGAGDARPEAWNAVADARKNVTDDVRAANDGIIRQQVTAMNSHLEAGGLMVPLAERKHGGKGKTRIADASMPATSEPSAAPKISGQFDGPGDSDDDKQAEEEDAINSDLDDSDDELAEGIEDSVEGNVILCLFDKVQRVKNKWKTTLKDGVVTVDGKDYVFHKAQGEFEW